MKSLLIYGIIEELRIWRIIKIVRSLQFTHQLANVDFSSLNVAGFLMEKGDSLNG